MQKTRASASRSRGSRAKALLSPFVTIRAAAAASSSRALQRHVQAQMTAIAAELRAARTTCRPERRALKTYLDAAATSFTTNDWLPADEAWSK